MPYADVVEAHITGDLEFVVRFADGLEGPVRLRASFLHGVFEALRDRGTFRQLTVENGFVSWPGDIDLAPDAMYDAIRRNGAWVLE